MKSGRLALALLFAVAIARAESTTVAEEWFVVRLAGTNIGSVSAIVKRTGDGLFESAAESRFVIRRGGVEISVSQSETTVEREDGRPVSIRSSTTMSNHETVKEVAIEGGKARVLTTILGQPREITVDCPEDVIGPWRQQKLALEGGLTAGRTYEARVFNADAAKPLRISGKVVGPETIDLLDGSKPTLARVDETLEGFGITTTRWLREDGRTERMRIPLGGLVMEVFRTTKEQALGGPKDEAPADLLDASLVKNPTLVPGARRLESAVLVLKPKAGTRVPDVADERQKVVALRDDGGVVLRMSRLVPPEGRTGKRPLGEAPEGVRECLGPSPLVQSDAPEIAAMAKEAVGDCTDAWEAARRIERFVHDAIDAKGFDVGFASALEVARERRGDCTEHAVLFCALCRAAGIPSRVVMGIECIGRVWGGHAWGEVWIEGAWYQLDATLGYGSVDALHLSLAKSPLRETGVDVEFAGLIAGLGAFGIEITEATLDGRTFQPGRADAETIDGRSYKNTLFGISFLAPEGFEVTRPRERSGIRFDLVDARRKKDAGPRCRISVDAMDAPADPRWERFVAPAAEGRAVSTLEVGGRDARLIGEVERLQALVIDGPTLYVFEMSGDGSAALFGQFLATVRFGDGG